MEFPRYMTPMPGSASTVSSSFFEPHRPSARGTTFKDPIPPLRDGQAPRSHLSMDKSSEEGSKFVAEQLIPLHSFSPEKLVPRYPMDSSAPSPQEQLQTKKSPGPPINYTQGGFQRGLPDKTHDLYPVERAGDKTAPHSSNLNVEEFMARQSAKARSRPPHWQTQCPGTMKPLGDPAGGCHYGPSCIYGHDGDVYKENLSVYYTFENGRSCPNFISPATPGPLLGVQGLSPPGRIPEANPQAQTLHAGQSIQELGGPRTIHPHHAPGHRDTEVGASVVQPDFSWLHASQPAALGSGQPETSDEEPFIVDESLFRREPLISMADYIAHCNNIGLQPLSVSEIAAAMEAQYMMEGGGAPENVQPN